jgi:hypothetical protein
MSAHSLLILAALVGGCSVASAASAEQFNVQSSAVLVKTSLSFSSNQPRNFTLRENSPNGASAWQKSALTPCSVVHRSPAKILCAVWRGN